MTEQTDAAAKGLSDEERGLMHGLAKRTGVDGVIQYVEVILAAREAAARAEALRAAADAWTQGAWSDVMLPKPTPPAVPVIAYSNRMGDWLRDRADSIAGTDGAGS